MTDKDKVIKSIECCLRPDNTNLCGECSYKDVPYNCKHTLIKDVYELLKEQEAVKPRVSSVEQRCGNCNKVIEMDGWLSCPWCGKRIDWEGWWKKNGTRNQDT